MYIDIYRVKVLQQLYLINYNIINKQDDPNLK